MFDVYFRQKTAETELNYVMGILKEKQDALAKVEKHIANLEAMFNASVQEQQDLENGIILTNLRLVRAGRLTMALGDEQIRWEKGVMVSKSRNYKFTLLI